MTDTSFDCVNSNLLLCEENTDTCFDDEFGLLSSPSFFQQKKKQHQQQTNDNRSECLMSLPLQSEDRIRTMVEKESEHLPREDYLHRLRTGDLNLSIRREALDWIWKVWSFVLIICFFLSNGILLFCLFVTFFNYFLNNQSAFVMQFRFLGLGFLFFWYNIYLHLQIDVLQCFLVRKKCPNCL